MICPVDEGITGDKKAVHGSRCILRRPHTELFKGRGSRERGRGAGASEPRAA